MQLVKQAVLLSTIAVICRFHRILLSWDYYALCKRAEEGKGVYDTLRRVPNTFASIQVRSLAAATAAVTAAAAATARAGAAAAVTLQITALAEHHKHMSCVT
jgi:hypothetical protein